jgi:hypothetical protein
MAGNPSADRFGPPPEQAARERERLSAGAKRGIPWTLVLIAAVIWLKYEARTGHGWTAGLSGILAMVGVGAQYVLGRRRKDARDGGPDPYSPPTHLTR